MPGAGEVVDVELDRLGAVLRGVGEGQRPLAGDDQVGGAVLVAEGVTADHDRLRPAGHQARHVGDHDRLAEDDAAEDVADRPVRRAVHLLQAELLDPRLVGGDRRALDADPVPLDRVGGVDRDLVVGRVAALDPEVEVLEVDVEVGQDQLLFDERPDDAGHLVAVELDDRVLDLDLRHRRAMLSTWRPRSRRRRGKRSKCHNRYPMATAERQTFGNHEVANQPPPLVDYNVFEADRTAGRGGPARGRRVGRAADLRGRRPAPAASAPSRSAPWPTRTRRSCAPTTATATASTRSSSTPPGTSCWARRSRTNCTAPPGRTRGPAPTSPAAPPSCACPRPRPGSAARSR